MSPCTSLGLEPWACEGWGRRARGRGRKQEGQLHAGSPQHTADTPEAPQRAMHGGGTQAAAGPRGAFCPAGGRTHVDLGRGAAGRFKAPRMPVLFFFFLQLF